ncbi:EF-hand domain-containing protein [Ciceribacter thiooxidans]|uniref:EF-hand domain-containing protein n=1 Tax=Ciceribacter thiooxidans TaxID=1969821 RepID=A0ABV7I7Q5_9HYPH|nr:EF-hand domain-containing protein [Ciceribacter thiooxidans]
MKTITTFAAVLMLSFAGAGYATAGSDHGHGNGPLMNDNMSSDGQGDMMQNMMRMMMQMHGQMMGSGPGSGTAMMDDDMMRMMMGADMMGAGVVGSPKPEAVRAMMLGRLSEFDADNDGSLTLAEFEALHTAMIREMTVDRFQHVDADGDGRITETEMGAPARRMEMRRGMPGSPGTMGGQMPSGN